MAPVFYVFMALLAVIFRYQLQSTQACLYVGRAISDTGTKTGFQDAVTSPGSSSLAILVWVLTAVVIGYGFFGIGSALGIALIVEFIAIATLTGVLLPKPDSIYWVRRIYASLARRTADYARKNDVMRSDATRMLASRIEERMPDKLVE
jgi:hypothetical protein